MHRSRAVCLAVFLFACGARPSETSSVPHWASNAESSDARAQRLVDIEAALQPEGLADLADPKIDARAMDVSAAGQEKARLAFRAAASAYASEMEHEENPVLRIDLAVLAKAANDEADRIDIETKYDVPFFELSNAMLEALSPLLDPDATTERKNAGLERLKAYAGIGPELAPVSKVAEARIRARMSTPGLLFPPRTRVEHYLKSLPTVLGAMKDAFAGSKLAGYADALHLLEAQLTAYDAFIEREILPHAREDFHRPEERYLFDLRQRGIDEPPRELAAEAHAAFREIQAEMDVLARDVAKQRGIPFLGYRGVLATLKHEQMSRDALVPIYRRRITDVEAIIRDHHLVTLPTHALAVRVASPAESIRIPAPFYQPPPLFHSTANGEFVLPTQDPKSPASGFDDFSFDAATWWLTAHEGRPGHDLQYATIRESQPTIARGLFGFNSANVEGWGLYAESLIEPYAPADGRLVCLDARLMRAAHAFLDIELNLGVITEAEAKRVMTEDVGFSSAWADQSVQRYTYWLPGQAPSYFYGYSRLLALRAEMEKKLGADFNLQRFDDCVLAQGVLPEAILSDAVRAARCGAPPTLPARTK